MTIYNTSALFFLNRILGERYKLNGDASSVCRYNAAVAQIVGRGDLVQAWRLAELVARSRNLVSEDDLPWSLHPFGKQLVQSLIQHYADKCDIQMAAMLCCVFGKEYGGAMGRKSIDISVSIFLFTHFGILHPGNGVSYKVNKNIWVVDIFFI